LVFTNPELKYWIQSMSFILEAKNLKKSFDGVVALSDANFTLNQGEICGLVGANGSGKTTLHE